MKITVLPPEDPAVVRAREGFRPAASWYSPRRQRPTALKKMQGNPTSDVRESEERG